MLLTHEKILCSLYHAIVSNLFILLLFTMRAFSFFSSNSVINFEVNWHLFTVEWVVEERNIE